MLGTLFLRILCWAPVVGVVVGSAWANRRVDGSVVGPGASATGVGGMGRIVSWLGRRVVAATTQVRLLVRTVCFMSWRRVLGAKMRNAAHMPLFSRACSTQYVVACRKHRAGALVKFSLKIPATLTKKPRVTAKFLNTGVPQVWRPPCDCKLFAGSRKMFMPIVLSRAS